MVVLVRVDPLTLDFRQWSVELTCMDMIGCSDNDLFNCDADYVHDDDNVDDGIDNAAVDASDKDEDDCEDKAQ